MGSTNAPVFPDPSAPARSGPFPAKTKAGAELRVRGRVHRTMPSGIAVPWSAWGNVDAWHADGSCFPSPPASTRGLRSGLGDYRRGGRRRKT
jgi:hypothetical protein